MNAREKSLFTLVGELPEVISKLISAEVNRIKAELGFKARNYGIGVGLVAIAGFVSIFLLGTLIATGIIALAMVMPAWAAALSVSGVLLLIVLILVAVAARRFVVASEDPGIAESVRRDVDAVRGMGPYDQ